MLVLGGKNLHPTTALNGDISKLGHNTYIGWKAMEVVTQGDLLGGYRIPGQFDGVGVSAKLPSVYDVL